MQKTNRKLSLRTDTIRNLSGLELSRARGGMMNATSRAATDGNTGCQSEATGCYTCAWSEISCC
jgi:hypothetical protein